MLLHCALESIITGDKPLIKMVETDGAAEKNPDHLCSFLFYMASMRMNETGVYVLLKSAPHNSFVNKVETFMANISVGCAGAVFLRARMSDKCESVVGNNSREQIRKMCSLNSGLKASITESMKPVLEVADELMSKISFKCVPVKIIPNPSE